MSKLFTLTTERVQTVAGSECDMKLATGFMIEFESGERQYLAGTGNEVYGMCDRFDDEGKTVAHARLCIKRSAGYTVLA